MQGLERIVSEHRLFEGLGDAFVKLAAGCAKNVRFNDDEYLFHAEILRTGFIWFATVASRWRW